MNRSRCFAHTALKSSNRDIHHCSPLNKSTLASHFAFVYFRIGEITKIFQFKFKKIQKDELLKYLLQLRITQVSVARKSKIQKSTFSNWRKSKKTNWPFIEFRSRILFFCCPYSGFTNFCIYAKAKF
jgi:hypothetical protein